MAVVVVDVNKKLLLGLGFKNNLREKISFHITIKTVNYLSPYQQHNALYAFKSAVLI